VELNNIFYYPYRNYTGQKLDWAQEGSLSLLQDDKDFSKEDLNDNYCILQGLFMWSWSLGCDNSKTGSASSVEWSTSK
jgi:hypothetical protein